MKYLIMDGSQRMLYKNAYDNKEEAETEITRLQDLRDKENEAHKRWTYKQRGDAFMRPQYNEDKFWLKTLLVYVTETFVSIREDCKNLQNEASPAIPPIPVEGFAPGSKVRVTIQLL